MGGVRHISITLDSRLPAYQAKARQSYGLLLQHQGVRVFDPTLTEAKDKVVLEFMAVQKDVPGLLTLLGTVQGIGTQPGARVAIAELIATLPTVPPPREIYSNVSEKPLSNEVFRERMSVDEIFSQIDGASHLTFDYVAMTAAAAAIAAAGLVQDSSVTVVSSMLISPLMSPILSITFGLAVGHTQMTVRGLRNEIIGVLIALLVGIVTGTCLAPLFGPHEWSSDLGPEAWTALAGSNVSWPYALDSVEMTSRGSPKSLISGTLIAIPSGFGVVLAVSGGGANALVGVAIAAALLPPVVNCGLCIALGGWWQYLDPQANWWRDILESLWRLNPRPVSFEAVENDAAAQADHARRLLLRPAMRLLEQQDSQTQMDSKAEGAATLAPLEEAPGVFADSLHAQTVQAIAALAAGAKVRPLPVGGPRRHPYAVVAMHGFWSFVLFALNLICIVTIGSVTFWLKGVSRTSQDLPSNFAAMHQERRGKLRRLWQESVRRVVRGAPDANGAATKERRVRDAMSQAGADGLTLGIVVQDLRDSFPQPPELGRTLSDSLMSPSHAAMTADPRYVAPAANALL